MYRDEYFKNKRWRSLLWKISLKLIPWVIPVFILILRNKEFKNKYGFCTILLIYYTERNFVISYDLSNTIHTCFIHEVFFYFDKDSFTWYNYLSVLFNLNKEVYSSFANALLNTNHETISLHSYNWNKSLMFIPVCAVKYLIHVLYKTFFRSPELWKCNILTSLRLLVSNMRKYNYNFFFSKYIVAFISHTVK